MVGQELVVAAVVADAEHIQLGVVQLHEVGLVDQTLHFGEQPLGFAALCAGEGVEVSFHGIQAGHEIAAVAGADEKVGQCLERLHVIPVVQMSVPFLKPADGVDDMLQPVRRFVVAYEAQFRRADSCGERIADVGGRGLVVGLVLAVKLVVVGDKPVMLLGDHAVEEMPCVLGYLPDLRILLYGEAVLVMGEFFAEPVHQEGCAAP